MISAALDRAAVALGLRRPAARTRATALLRWRAVPPSLKSHFDSAFTDPPSVVQYTWVAS